MMLETLRGWALRTPGRIAVRQDDEAISYLDFFRRVESFRRHFASMNLPVGGNVVVMIGHLTDHWCACLALRSLGLTAVPVNTLAQADTLALADPVLVVVSEPELPKRDLRSATLAGVRFHALGMAAFAGMEAISPEMAPPLTAPFGNQVLQSSGTTGVAKKLLVLGANQEVHAREQAQKWHFTAETVYNGLEFPGSTMIGFHAPPAMWSVGGCMRFDQRTDWPERFFRYGTSSAFVLPPMIRQIHAAWASSGLPPQNCELRPGGGFVTQDLLAHGQACLSRPMRVVYGSTELTTYSLSQLLHTPEDLLWLSPDQREVQLVNAEGQEVAAGEEGELRIRRLPTDCTGYLGDPASSATHFRGEWFYPGDLATRRADGRVRILGRVSDVLVVAGRKLAMVPLEQHVQRILGVQEVCLFSQLDKAGFEELVIAIQAPATPEAALLDRARAEFTEYFNTVRCVVLPAFPRTATAMAKVRRAELRRMLFDEPPPG